MWMRQEKLQDCSKKKREPELFRLLCYWRKRMRNVVKTGLYIFIAVILLYGLSKIVKQGDNAVKQT